MDRDRIYSALGNLELGLIVFGPRTHRVLLSDLNRRWQSKKDDLRPPAKGNPGLSQSAIWQPKQVKQNSEGGKKWVCVLREPKLRNPNYSMFAKATILTIHFDQTLGA